MKRLAVTWCLLLGLCIPAFAAEQTPTAPSAPAAFSIPDETTDEQLDVINRKVSCYVQVLNDFGGVGLVEAMQNRLDLLRNRKPADPWQIRNDTNGYGPRFTTALKNNAALTPRIEPADTAMDQIAETYPRMMATLAELDKYFARGDNKDDGDKKGQELGKQLKADFAVFMNAHEVLEQSHARIDRALSNVNLARFEKAYGKKFYWLHTVLLRQAEDMLEMAPPQMKDFDAVAFEAAFRHFKTLVDDYESYIKAAGADLKKEANGRIREKWITEYISTCRTLLEAKKENIPNKYKNFVEVLYTYYNNMVDDSNGVRFTMPPQ